MYHSKNDPFYHKQCHQQYSPYPYQPSIYGGYMYPPQQVQQDAMYRQIDIVDAIEIARRQVAGQVVDAELERKGERLIYEIEIITSENVKYDVEIDANTGEVLQVAVD